MPSFFKRSKILIAYTLTEVIAAASLILLDYVINTTDPNFDKKLFLNRFYFFEKNIVLLACMKVLQQEMSPHAYAALFNSGALLALYPQSQLTWEQENIQSALRAAIVLTGGLALRTPIEMWHAELSRDEYVGKNIGKLITGLAGIAISFIGTPVAASCYWIGALIDLIRQRDREEKIESLFLARTIVPIQILIALPIKLALFVEDIQLPFTYLFDVMAAMILLVGFYIRELCGSKEEIELVSPSIRSESV